MRNFFQNHLIFFVFLAAIILLIGGYLLYYPKITHKDSIKVGILFPTSGPLAASGKSAVKGVMLAIEEINKNGGIHHKKIIPVIYNPAADWNLYANLTKHLILQDEVKTIFGCISSASRKVVKPLVEQYNNLLVYPTSYEGIEASKNIIYIGPIPNQQIVPAVSFMILKGYKRFFIVGLDDIYSHVANEIIAHEVKNQGGEIVGISYISLKNPQIEKVINHIQSSQPDIVFNTMSGEETVEFFNRLNRLAPRPPVLSFNMANQEINKINRLNMINDYFSWTYYPDLKSDENKSLQQAYLKKYGSIADIDATTVNAYESVYLWKQGMEESPSAFPRVVRDFMLRTSEGSASGIIYIDPVSGQAWRSIYINQLDKNGQYKTIWHSTNPIQPVIYPEFKTKTQWELFEHTLYLDWGSSWESHND